MLSLWYQQRHMLYLTSSTAYTKHLSPSLPGKCYVERAVVDAEFIDYVARTEYENKALMILPFRNASLYETFQKQLDPKWEAPESLLLKLVRDHDGAVCTIAFADLKLDHALGVIEILHLFVEKRFRRQGFGTTLLHEAVKVLNERRHRFGLLRLECLSEDVQFYTKAGFVDLGITPIGLHAMAHESCVTGADH